jgi:DUF1365 family protein
MSVSAIYEGTIRHRRVAVTASEFTHSVALMYLDLDELPNLLGGRLARRTPGLLRFRRSDYLGDSTVPLAEAVRARVAEQIGAVAEGPTRMLTQLRSFGHCFNPVSFYYCFDGADRLQAVLAEVTNTPWGERRSYVLARTGDGPVMTASFAKQLHVSPFMGMDQSYQWRLTAPGSTLSVHIESIQDGKRAFDATLALRRAELTRVSLARVSARYPAATLRVLALIYGHAVALKLRGVPVHPHPEVSA